MLPITYNLSPVTCYTLNSHLSPLLLHYHLSPLLLYYHLSPLLLHYHLSPLLLHYHLSPLLLHYHLSGHVPTVTSLSPVTCHLSPVLQPTAPTCAPRFFPTTWPQAAVTPVSGSLTGQSQPSQWPGQTLTPPCHRRMLQHGGAEGGEEEGGSAGLAGLIARYRGTTQPSVHDTVPIK